MNARTSAVQRVRWVRTVAIGLVLLAALVALAFLARGAAQARSQGGPATADVPRMEGDTIRFSPDFATRAGLVRGQAERASIAPVIDVSGTVTFDASATAAIGARIPGRVRHVVVLEGQVVKRGQALAEIESAELGQAQAAVPAARAHAEAASLNERRQFELAEANAASRREAEQAHALAEAARADLTAAEQRVRALGGAPNDEIGILTLRSPIAGTVVERNVSRGQSVGPTQSAFVVADLSRLWAELAVFEREIGAMRVGDRVELHPQGDPTSTVEGRISHVGDVIDRESRSADVRVVVPNPNGRLRPGQSVLARIHTAAASPRLVVPRDAVLSVDGKPTLFVARDATSVSPRHVELGVADGDRVEIVSGLDPSEAIIVSGAFALKSELFR